MTAGMFLIAPGADLSEAKLSRTNQLESHDPNSDIALAGEISWCQKIEPDHGIRFFLILEMEIKQGEGLEQGTATATLAGQTEDGAMLLMRAAKEKFILDQLEEVATEEMEIDPEENGFELLAQGTSHSLNYR